MPANRIFNRARVLLAAVLLLSPAIGTAGGFGAPGVSIPSIPGPGLDRDCVGELKNLSDREAARRVHACSKPYQPGPNGDARIKAAHPATEVATPSSAPGAPDKVRS